MMMANRAGTDSANYRRRLFVFLGIAAALLAAMAFLFFRDEPLGDHSDLALPKDGVAADHEKVFEAWLAVFAKADATAWESIDREFLQSVAGNGRWQAQRVADILDANRGALEAAVPADKLGRFALPRMDRIDEPVPYLSDVQLMAKNLKLLAIERAVAGDFPASRDAASVNLRYARHVVEGNNSLIGFLVGVTCEAIALSAVDAIADHGAPDALLAELEGALRDEIDAAACYQNCLRREFALSGDSLDQVDEIFPAADPGAPPVFLFKRNRTANRMAEMYRTLIADAERAPAARAGIEEYPEPKGLGRISSNALGDYILSVAAPVHPAIVAKVDYITAKRRLLRTKLAILRFEAARGQLPSALAELVPGFLDAVPADPYDGKPLRYDPVRRALWVAGRDLRDGGGMPGLDPKNWGLNPKSRDPTLFLHPAAAAAAP